MLKLHGRDVTDSLEIAEAFNGHFEATVCTSCCTSDGNPLFSLPTTEQKFIVQEIEEDVAS